MVEVNHAERRALILSVYERIFEFFGPQHWWPADSPFEVIVGAILTQNTAWRNVRMAINRLKEEGVLSCAGIHGLSAGRLSELIRSSGYYNVKAGRLKAFCEHIITDHGGDLAGFLRQDLETLRPELLRIKGIGPETADSIVLYAAEKPSFVVDAYTFRVFTRHAWIGEGMTYEDLRRYFMDVLDPDVPLFKEYHALLVRTGHFYCKRKPHCELCPLKGWN